MERIDIVANASNDLLGIAKTDPKGAAGVFALIKEMRTNQILQSRLLDKKFSDQAVSTSRWIELYRNGKNLYRVKEINASGQSTSKYRIIYAYIIGTGKSSSQFYIMAIVDRDKFNYELHNDYTKRILADYDGLC